MDAKELTKKYFEEKYRADELEKKVGFLEQEVSKQRLLLDDLRIDVQMIMNSKRSVRTE